MTSLFSDADRQRIAAAIEAVETTSSGEIVPYVILRSAPYPVVPWRGGALGALVGTVLVALIRTAPAPAPAAFALSQDGLAVLIIAACGLIGALAASRIPPLTRRLAGDTAMREAVHQRAVQVFVDEEVFATRHRTGILLVVSLMERRVEVLADAGINVRVGDGDWHNVTACIRTGIENGQLADGLVDAIHQCGQLLMQYGFAAEADDQDELPNRLRTPEE